MSRTVVCAEYSASLQLEVFGVRLTALPEPVLDIGCGLQAALVRQLRATGLEAYGLDRLVDTSPYLIEADWLQFDFTRRRWGTVISHMAFSNHFIFHHLSLEGNPELYAQCYMQILHSLKPGGAFYYAPGLPFIERFLPQNRFLIQMIKLKPVKEEPAAERVGYQTFFGEDIFYATKIMRR